MPKSKGKFGGKGDGFRSIVYGDATAALNKTNYFQLHSDLVSRGIPLNGKYEQVIAQVLIDVPPGSQVVYQPHHPPRIAAPELAGARKSVLRFWLTDDASRPVDTNGEAWSARVVIRYSV